MSGRDEDREGELLEALAYMLASDVLEDADELASELAVMNGSGEAIADSLLAEARTKIAQQRRDSLTGVDEGPGVVPDEPTAYADTSGDELDQLWAARGEGMDPEQIAVAHRELTGVSDYDKRTMHQDLDLLEDNEEPGDGGDDE